MCLLANGRSASWEMWCRDYLNPGSILETSEAMSGMFGNWSGTTSRSQKIRIPTLSSQNSRKDAVSEYQVSPLMGRASKG